MRLGYIESETTEERRQGDQLLQSQLLWQRGRGAFYDCYG
jgi:hypothetical protein